MTFITNFRTCLQYFLKTGTCKYGGSCKYHHPRDRRGAGPVTFNILGLPMGQVRGLGLSILCYLRIDILDSWNDFDEPSAFSGRKVVFLLFAHGIM